MRPEAMRAWRVHGPGDMRLDIVPAPEPAKGEALLKVLTLQPSITEVAGLAGAGLGSPQIARAVAERQPVALYGHEFSARVLAVRAPSAGIRPGDRVASLGRIPCGRCAECAARRPFHCAGGEMLGITRPGCLADLVSVPTKVLARVPDALSDAEAAGLQPLASVVGAMRRLGPAVRGKDVAVLGLGLMGLLAAQVVTAYGASGVLGVSTRSRAVDAARALGITSFHLPSDAEELSRRYGSCRVIIDCSGRAHLPGIGLSTVDLAARLGRPGAAVVQIALYDEPLAMDTTELKRKCMTYVMPPFSTRGDLGRAVALVAGGHVRIAPLLTVAVEGLEHLPDAFGMTLEKGERGIVGPVQLVASR